MKAKSQATSEPRPTWTALSLSILNGVVGDYLQERGNGLAIEMGFYHHNRPLPLSSAAITHVHSTPTGKICLLLHGLVSNEGIWAFADPAQPAEQTSYGALLQRDLGFTSFYVRYNSGLPIGENGCNLAGLIEQLLASYPVPISEIVLIGHSMGGLVIRSACELASQNEAAWVQLVTRAFYIGTPHDGANLARFAHGTVALLQAIPNPITRLIGTVINIRSQGIQDLRHGAAHAAPNISPDPAWLPCMKHYLLVGTLTKNPRHLITLLFGDALVQIPDLPQSTAATPPSAGPHSDHLQIFPGVHHLALAHNSAVYQQIKRWCEQ